AATPPGSLAWAIWGLGAELYFIGFYQRVSPAVITSELTDAFALTAAGLGNLSAFYFYSYVAMQIPTGILADRLGPRRLLTAGALVAGLGTAVFAVAQDVNVANLGRLLIGASVGVAFVSMLKIAAHWMPPRQYALTSGVALAVGVLGAVSAGAPLRMLVNEFGWRNVMWMSAALTLLVAVATWLMVRDDPAERGYLSYFEGTHAAAGDTRLFDGLKEVLRLRNVVLLFFIPGAASSMVLTFAGLWGVPFLVTHYGLTPTGAAGLCSAMMVAWAIGSISYSAASDRLGRRKPLYIGGMVLSLLLWAALIYVHPWPYAVLSVLLCAIGFFSGCFIISFAFAKESGPARLAGTVSGISNMGVIQGPMYMQPLVGVILDRHWSGALDGGKRVFDFASYQQGFSLILVWGLAALVLLFMTRETYCRQNE
ncbi:MAG: MFS transporter, partial [Betaproteobacteria bacterium]